MDSHCTAGLLNVPGPGWKIVVSLPVELLVAIHSITMRKTRGSWEMDARKVRAQGMAMTQDRDRTVYFHLSSVTQIHIDEQEHQEMSAPKHAPVQKLDGRDP